MKKTATAMLTLVAGIVAASCQKEAEPDIKSFEPITINAVSEGIGTATKTEMIYKYDIAWSANDQIYVTDGTSNDTFTLSDGEGTTKGTFTQDGTASFTSEVQAYYPATMVQNGGLVWPATQTNNQTVPMYSTKTVSGNVEDFNFTSLGSVLQIVFNSKQENVTLRSIEIKDGSLTMSGAFTVDEDGKANITATDNAGITLDLGESGVALGNGANYFYIAVPAGNYQNLTLTFTATDGAQCVMKNGKVNIEHNTVGRLTLTGKTFKPDLPAGALPGVFTVSNDDGTTKTQIYFSQGNLYYDGSKFNFEANQYGFNSIYQSTYVSHFYWSKDVEEAVKQDFNWEQSMSAGDVFFTNADGFKVNAGGKEQSGWRTLSTKEWQYLFNTRTMKNGKDRYTLNITYGGKMGLVLYPDDYDKDPVTGTVTDLPDGVVFLPAAGYRSGAHVYLVGESGFFSEFNNYWSSSANDEYSAFAISFDPAAIGTDCTDYRDLGSCVRLVADVK